MAAAASPIGIASSEVELMSNADNNEAPTGPQSFSFMFPLTPMSIGHNAEHDIFVNTRLARQ